MAKPSGVGSFSHKAIGSTGSKYPSDVRQGKDGVSIESGTSPAGEEITTSGSDSNPSGVKRNSGTENYRASERYYGSTTSGYAKKRTTKSNYPSGVARHSGK